MENKKIEKKIYIVGGDTSYIFYGQNPILNGIQRVARPEEADIIMFTGGEDISPILYGHKMSNSTYTNIGRDKREVDIFDKFVNTDKKFIGICRGAQLLCALSGGKIVQDIHHNGTHDVTQLLPEYKNSYKVNSLHHQLMYPFNLSDEKDYVMIAYTKNYDTSPNVIKFFDNQFDEKYANIHSEIVWFKNTNSLCIQSHPEYSDYPQETLEFICNLFIDFLNNDKSFSNKETKTIINEDFEKLKNDSKNKYSSLNSNDLYTMDATGLKWLNDIKITYEKPRKVISKKESSKPIVNKEIHETMHKYGPYNSSFKSEGFASIKDEVIKDEPVKDEPIYKSEQINILEDELDSIYENINHIDDELKRIGHDQVLIDYKKTLKNKIDTITETLTILYEE